MQLHRSVVDTGEEFSSNYVHYARYCGGKCPANADVYRFGIEQRIWVTISHVESTVIACLFYIWTTFGALSFSHSDPATWLGKLTLFQLEFAK